MLFVSLFECMYNMCVHNTVCLQYIQYVFFFFCLCRHIHDMLTNGCIAVIVAHPCPPESFKKCQLLYALRFTFRVCEWDTFKAWSVECACLIRWRPTREWPFAATPCHGYSLQQSNCHSTWCTRHMCYTLLFELQRTNLSASLISNLFKRFFLWLFLSLVSYTLWAKVMLP